MRELLAWECHGGILGSHMTPTHPHAPMRAMGVPGECHVRTQNAPMAFPCQKLMHVHSKCMLFGYPTPTKPLVITHFEIAISMQSPGCGCTEIAWEIALRLLSQSG